MRESRGDAQNHVESVKGRLCAEKTEGRGGSTIKQVPPQPDTIPALGLRAGAMVL
jgi:hypothetical protein